MKVLVSSLLLFLFTHTTGQATDTAPDDCTNKVQAYIKTEESGIKLSGKNFTFESNLGGPECTTSITLDEILARIVLLESKNDELMEFKENVVNGDCPEDTMFSGVNSDGTFICTNATYQQREGELACPQGQTVTNILNNGSVLCKPTSTPAQVNATIGATKKIVYDSLECSEMGLHYDVDNDQCVPAFIHKGCPSTVAGAFGVCATSNFSDTCDLACKPGTTSTPRKQSFECGALAKWKADEQNAECKSITTCPKNSANPPECKCNVGYRIANSTWFPGNASYHKDRCEVVPCPAMNTKPYGQGPSKCECPEGYKGTLTFSKELSAYNTSGCTPIPCPSGAGGSPSCKCLSTHVGTLKSTRTGWSGTCVKKISQTICKDSGGENRWQPKATCTSGTVIKEIQFSCYGRYARCSNTNCGCGRNLKTHSRYSSCIGKRTCGAYHASNGWWGDPCGGHSKHLVTRYICRNY